MSGFGSDPLARLEQLVWGTRGDTLAPWKAHGLTVVRTALAWRATSPAASSRCAR